MKVLKRVYRHSVSEPDAAQADSSTPLDAKPENTRAIPRQDNGGGAGARPAGGLAQVWIDDKGFHMELLPLGETQAADL